MQLGLLVSHPWIQLTRVIETVFLSTVGNSWSASFYAAVKGTWASTGFGVWGRGGGGGLDPILRVRSYTGVSTRVDALHTHISVCWSIQGLPSIFYLSFYIPEFLFWLYFYWMDFVFKYFFPLQEWLVGALFSYFFKCSLCLYLQYA